MTWKLKPGFSMCVTTSLMGRCEAVEEGWWAPAEPAGLCSQGGREGGSTPATLGDHFCSAANAFCPAFMGYASFLNAIWSPETNSNSKAAQFNSSPSTWNLFWNYYKEFCGKAERFLWKGRVCNKQCVGGHGPADARAPSTVLAAWVNLLSRVASEQPTAPGTCGQTSPQASDAELTPSAPIACYLRNGF